MKKILLLIVTLAVFGCSKNDCEVRKAEITTKYQQMIAYASHGGENGEPNYNQIQALEKEMQKKLAKACD